MEYILYSESTGSESVYSLEIIESSKSGSESCRLSDIARSEEKAREILSIFADNTVTLESVYYVLDSLADEMTFC